MQVVIKLQQITLMITACSHSLKGVRLTPGQSWLYHLQNAENHEPQFEPRCARTSYINGNTEHGLKPHDGRMLKAVRALLLMSASRLGAPEATALGTATLHSGCYRSPRLGAILSNSRLQALVLLNSQQCHSLSGLHSPRRRHATAWCSLYDKAY